MRVNKTYFSIYIIAIPFNIYYNYLNTVINC